MQQLANKLNRKVELKHMVTLRCDSADGWVSNQEYEHPVRSYSVVMYNNYTGSEASHQT